MSQKQVYFLEAHKPECLSFLIDVVWFPSGFESNIACWIPNFLILNINKKQHITKFVCCHLLQIHRTSHNENKTSLLSFTWYDAKHCFAGFFNGTLKYSIKMTRLLSQTEISARTFESSSNNICKNKQELICLYKFELLSSKLTTGVCLLTIKKKTLISHMKS